MFIIKTQIDLPTDYIDIDYIQYKDNPLLNLYIHI